MRPFISLHNHTTFSIGDSLITPTELFETAKSLNQSAIAVTDHGTASGLFDCLKQSKKTKVKLIAGIEYYFVDSVENKESSFKHLILLAKNANGYKNLLTINKIGFDNSVLAFKKVVPRIDWKILERYSEDLICTTACGNGIVGQMIMRDNFDGAKNVSKRLKDIFGDDFVLELQANKLQRRPTAYSGQVNQEKVNMGLKKISQELNIRAIVTTNAHYVTKDQSDVHDVWLCNASGQPITSGNRLIYDKPDFYIKSADEVFDVFARHLPIWGKDFVDSLFENTEYYADKCEVAEWISPAFVTGEKSQLPDFPYRDEPDYPEFLNWVKSNKEVQGKAYKDGVAEDALFYRYRSELGLHERVAAGKIPEVDLGECYENMSEEFDVLEYRGFSSYMLIAADFLNWCHRNDVLIGYGRGCLTGDAKVLTLNGYKDLKDIVVGDNVYTHTGLLKPVEKVFKYDVDETGLEIKTNYSFDTIKLTKDHKVFAARNVEDEPSWMKAGDLGVGDYIWMPFTEKCKPDYTNYKKGQSRRLKLKAALKLKEELLNKGIPSHVSKVDCDYIVKTSGDLSNIKETGYYCKIVKLSNYHLKEVYDIQVADDHSYLTSNYAVHNSVGGSLTAYTNNIHNSYPKKYNMIFARFLNKFKDAFPDIDNDIASSGRDKLCEYLKSKYGKDNFAFVSNVNTMTPKPYVKAIARMFNFGGEDRKEAVRIGNLIADSISADCKSIKQAVAECPVFSEFAKQHPELEKYSELCNKPSAWGVHAGGIIISKHPLIGLVPLRRDADGNLVLEYDKNRAEENGLIKIDLLGLKTLDIIEQAKRIIKKSGKEELAFDPEMEDELTYKMISDGDTGFVFQLGNSAVSVCKKIKPKNISDIALVNALVRPAAKDIIPEVVKIRNGEKAVHLLHPKLHNAYKTTYGYGLYEESLLYIARDIANWDLHSADRLRKFVKEKGKYPEKDQKLKEDFIADSVKNGFDLEIATEIYDVCISGFSGYGFNIPHATLYSMLSFYTAFLKAHYPVEFLVANLMNESTSKAVDSKDNIIKIKCELRTKDIKIVTPNINKSERAYKITDDKTIMSGLDSLKFMSEDSIVEILDKRPFISFKDLISRSNVKCQAISAVAAAGGLDEFGLNRKSMFFYATDYRAKLKDYINKNVNKIIRDWAKENKLKKIEDNKVVKYINANNIEHTPPTISEKQKQTFIDEFDYPFPKEADWTVQEKFALEEKYMGEGVSGTDFERYAGFFNQTTSLPYKYLPKLFPYEEFSLDEKENRKLNSHYLSEAKLKHLDGILTSVFFWKVKKEDSKIFGQEMCRFGIRDAFGGSEMTVLCFPEAWIAFKERVADLCGIKQKIEPGLAIRFICTYQWENEHSQSLILNELLSVKLPPICPKDLKSKKVKMPRMGKIEASEIEEMEKDDVVELIEEEIIEDGEVGLDDDIFKDPDDVDQGIDPFN